MIRQKNIFIITGGPGFGKTELITKLRELGFVCSGEFARDIIQEQLIIGGDLLPWKNPRLFQQEVLSKRINFFESVLPDDLAFADRGIPDQLAFAIYKGFGSSDILVSHTKDYRYALKVFITPPWPEIFENDAIRTESYEEACFIHKAVVATYLDYGYQLIELPLTTVDERINYILQNI